MMTNDENEFMQDVINQASNKVELLQKTVIEKAVEIERLKAEFKQLETNAEILARGVRDLNHENYELTEKIKQAQIEEIAKFDKLCYDYNKLLYIIRCNMTSITRYVRNENETYDKKYKELAVKAVENILKAINCEVKE